MTSLDIFLVKFHNLFLNLLFIWLIFKFIFDNLIIILWHLHLIFFINYKFIFNIFQQSYFLYELLVLKLQFFVMLVLFLVLMFFLNLLFMYNMIVLFLLFIFIFHILYFVISFLLINIIYLMFIDMNYIDLMKLLMLFVCLVIVYKS